MTKTKSILFFFLFLLFSVPLYWFVILLPYSTTQTTLRNLPQQINSSIVNQYPADLVITIENGQVSLNQPMPYCLKLSNTSQAGIVFDSNSKASLDAFEPTGPYSKLCQPEAVIGKDYFMALSDNQIRVNKIPAELNLVIDRPSISNFVTAYLPKIIAFGATAYFVLPFIFVPFALVFFLLQNLWYYFVVKLAAKIFKVNALNVYGTSLFIYLLIMIVRWLIISYLLNSLLQLKVTADFPFINTIIITAGSIFYFKNQSALLQPDSDPTPKLQSK